MATTNLDMTSSKFDFNLALKQTTEKAIAEASSAFATQVLMAAGEKYGFDADEACTTFLTKSPGIQRAYRAVKTSAPRAPKTVAWETPIIPLPWCGMNGIQGHWCQGLRLAHGLHSQCTMKPLHGGIYCATCQKHADASCNGIPTYGNVDMRAAVGLSEYRDPKGKQSVPYTTIMKKLGITREQAEVEAARFGITIPEEQFCERKLSKGRPKKSTDVASSDDEVHTDAKRSRGRPKKQKKVVVADSSLDLVAALQSQIADETASHDSESGPITHTDSTYGALEQPKNNTDIHSDAENIEETPEEKAARKAAKKAAKKAKKENASENNEETPEEKAARKAAKKAAKKDKNVSENNEETPEEKAARKAAKKAAKQAKKEELSQSESEKNQEELEPENPILNQEEEEEEEADIDLDDCIDINIEGITYKLHEDTKGLFDKDLEHIGFLNQDGTINQI